MGLLDIDENTSIAIRMDNGSAQYFDKDKSYDIYSRIFHTSGDIVTLRRERGDVQPEILLYHLPRNDLEVMARSVVCESFSLGKVYGRAARPNQYFRPLHLLLEIGELHQQIQAYRYRDMPHELHIVADTLQTAVDRATFVETINAGLYERNTKEEGRDIWVRARTVLKDSERLSGTFK